MKKLLLLISFLIALSGNLMAGTFGYSNGTVGRNNVARVGTTTLQGQIIRLNSEKVKMLAGKTISGVQATLASRNGSNLKLFVRESLDGADLAATSGATVSKTNQWSDYAFTAPYVVKGTEQNLYVGLTYEIATSYSPLSYDFSQDSKGVSYVYAEGQWIDTYGSGFGMPNVRLITAEGLDIADVMVKTFTPEGYLKTDVDYTDMKAQILNLGTAAVSGFTAHVKVGNGKESLQTFSGQNILSGQTFDITLPAMNAAEGGTQTVNVSISDVVFANGASTDADPSDNASATDVFFYGKDMAKRLLIEAFTGIACPNCPSGHTALHNAVSTLEAAGVEVIEVSHHAGYQADDFTMQEDYDYCVFYNKGGSTYAPAIMVNRWKNPQQSDPGPVFNAGTQLILDNAVAALNQEPYVTLDFTSDYNEATREAQLKVDVHCHHKPLGTSVLNIMIAQDGFVGYQASGGTEYEHNNVCRGTVTNNSWGIDITKALEEGKTYTYTKTYTLPEVITSTAGAIYGIGTLDMPTDASKMKLVAYVAAFDAENPNANEVYNCAATPLTGKASAISGIRTNAAKNTAMYNMAGQKVGADYRGIVIVNGKKVVR